MRFMAKKTIQDRSDINESSAHVLNKPIIGCKVIGTCEIPKDKQDKVTFF